MHAPGQPSPGRRPTPPGGGPAQPHGTAPPSLRRNPDLARSIWEIMSAFVLGNDPADELRRALGLRPRHGPGQGARQPVRRPPEPRRTRTADPPYATIIVNELLALGLLSRSQTAVIAGGSQSN